MKTGAELERGFLEVLANDVGPEDDGLYLSELIGSCAEYGAATPAEWRSGKAALARLLKRGEVEEDRESDANGLPLYRLPRDPAGDVSEAPNQVH